MPPRMQPQNASRKSRLRRRCRIKVSPRRSPACCKPPSTRCAARSNSAWLNALSLPSLSMQTMLSAADVPAAAASMSASSSGPPADRHGSPPSASASGAVSATAAVATNRLDATVVSAAVERDQPGSKSDRCSGGETRTRECATAAARRTPGSADTCCSAPDSVASSSTAMLCRASRSACPWGVSGMVGIATSVGIAASAPRRLISDCRSRDSDSDPVGTT